ncbi:PucR family transcriptional regulator, partial [Streptomyces sp. NPDC001536]|uniref:PucR family transcriptional regulator n=1 Tax=Streptomyces sp. NPDC001536 TaxID=3364583 RepID=UPI00368C1CCA
MQPTLGDEALAALVSDRLVAMRDAVLRDVVRTVRAEIGEFDQDPVARSLLEASITENIVAVLHFSARGIDAEHIETPTAALAHARMLAQRGIPLSALVRSYHVGHTQALSLFLTALDDLPADERAHLVVALVDRGGMYIHKVCEQVSRAYESERDRWLADPSGVRQYWVGKLLGGGPIDRAAAERALHYPLDTVHLGCALWPTSEMTPSQLSSAVEDVRAHLVTKVGARASLVVPTDAQECRLWLALPPGADRELGAFEPPAATRLHASLGRPGADLAGFRTTARQAAQVKEIIATRQSRPARPVAGSERPAEPQWVRYDDLAPVALMAGDLVAVHEFTAATLGALADTGVRNAMLRETLRTFLDHHRSHTAAAEVMQLHRNSVQYRVQQATALLPATARSLEHDFNVRAALLLVHWLGGGGRGGGARSEELAGPGAPPPPTNHTTPPTPAPH